MIAPPNKSANRRWRRVKNADPIFFDDFPESVRFRPVRSAFIHDRRRAVGERTIDDVAMARNPTDISSAPVNILISNVEYVLCRRVNADQIAASGVQDAFWF